MQNLGNLLGRVFFGGIIIAVLGTTVHGYYQQNRHQFATEPEALAEEEKATPKIVQPVSEAKTATPAPEVEVDYGYEVDEEGSGHELEHQWTIARIEAQTIVVEHPRGKRYTAALCADGYVRAISFDRTLTMDEPDASSSSTMDKRLGDHYRIETKRDLRGVCILFDDIDVAQTRTIFPGSDAPEECIDPGISRQACQQKIMLVCDPNEASRYLKVGEAGTTPEDLRFCLHQKVTDTLATTFGIVRQGTECVGYSTLSVGNKIYKLGSPWEGKFAADPRGSHGERCVFGGGEFAVDELTLTSRVLPTHAIARVFQWQNREFVLMEDPSNEGNRYKLLELASSGPRPVLSFYDYHFGGYSW